MKTLKIIVLAALGLFVSGCSTSQPVEDKFSILTQEEEEEPTIPSYSKNLVRGWPKGRKLNETDVSRVRYPESVHAYHMGRTPSRDRRTMREAHTVYRVEETAAWDERLPATPMKSIGPFFGINEPSHKPLPNSDLVATELTRQEGLTREMTKARDQLLELDAEMKARVLELRKAAEKKEDMTGEVKALEKEKKAVEEKLEKSNEQIKALERSLEEKEIELKVQKKTAGASDVGSRPAQGDRESGANFESFGLDFKKADKSGETGEAEAENQ